MLGLLHRAAGRGARQETGLFPNRPVFRSAPCSVPQSPAASTNRLAVSLEDLVPADHFYRHLEAKLDLGFVREWTRELYAERGRPSIDPVVFFKLQLVMFFEGIRSERKLIETASLNLAHRWYLGYALDEELPDHSSLTRIRQRLGVDIFQRFFEQVVDLCQEAGWSGAASSTSMPPRSQPMPTSIRWSRASITRPRPTSPACSLTIRRQPTSTRRTAPIRLPCVGLLLCQP